VSVHRDSGNRARNRFKVRNLLLFLGNFIREEIMAERSLNKVMLLGRLGRDPELRYTSSGRAVATFALATSSQWKDQDGNDQERTEWHRIVAWGRLGEICAQYLNKGKQVYLEGRIQTREWEDQEGNKRFTTEVVANDMIMLGGGGRDYPDSGGEGRSQGGSGQRRQGSEGKDSPSYEQPPPEDDIPF
jgi:single-strand DNA-binding protein